MTAPALFWTALSIAGVVAVPGALMRDREFSPVLLGLAGLLFSIIGLVILGSPLTYETGTSIVTAGSTTTVMPATSPLPSQLNTALGVVLALGGVGMVYAAFETNRSLKDRKEERDIDLGDLSGL